MQQNEKCPTPSNEKETAGKQQITTDGSVKNLDPIKEFLNISEVSKIIGLEESTIYGLTSKRKIPHYKPGKKLMFKRSEILSWIESSRQATSEEIINQHKSGTNG
ncbi:MAG: helix-turn-helix domain-containing protein [Flavobacteriales bacterium]